MEHASFVYATIDGVEYPGVIWNARDNLVVTADFCISQVEHKRPRFMTADSDDFHTSVGMPVTVLATVEHGVVFDLAPLRVRVSNTIRTLKLEDISYRSDYVTLTDRGLPVRCTVDTLPLVANLDGIKVIISEGEAWLVPPHLS